MDRGRRANARPDHLECGIGIHVPFPFVCSTSINGSSFRLCICCTNANLTPIPESVANIFKVDDLDRTIIAALRVDGRTPYAQIAERAGVATTTVHQRVKRLVEKGIITGTRVQVDWEAIGLPVTALVSLEAHGDRLLSEVADDLRAIPLIQDCYSVTGEFDLLLTVRARSSQHLGEVLEEIRRLAPGGRSRTIVVLATHFDGRVPPL